MGSRVKRLRSESRCVPLSEALSDGEGCGAGAAERKRELERNRRNLVNVRFAELENQLAQLPGAPTRVHRRLDKEVVLKDAAQSLAAQQRDLDDAIRRISTMTAEIDILRSEKLELRHDKAYLHNEIQKARAENKALTADNNALWDALRKTGAVKMPVDLLLRPAHLLRADHTHPSDGKGLQNISRHVDNATIGTNPTENGTECPRLRVGVAERLPTPMQKQERTQKENGDENAIPAQPGVDTNDLFANYPVMLQAVGATGNGKADGNGEENEEYLKLADDFRLRGLNPMMMMQYAFEDQREIPQIHMPLDDVNSQGLPDIAPCG